MDAEEIIVNNAKSVWAKELTTSKLGLEPNAFKLQVIKTVTGKEIERVVLRARSEEAGEYIFKYEPSLSNSDRFHNTITTYRRAETWFDTQSKLKIPKLLWYDPQHGAQLFEFIKGQTAFDRLDWSLDDQLTRGQVIEQCASWLHSFHTSGVAELKEPPREAKLGWVAKVASGYATRVRNQELEVPLPKMFLGLCAMLHRLVRQANGAPLNRSFLHGDPHLGNFIFGRNGFYGIDVTDRGVGPIEIDAARLLTRVLYKFDLPDDQDRLLGLSKADVYSFSRGYGQDLRASKLLVVFIALQILKDWSMMHRADIILGTARQRRFAKIEAIFRSLRASGY